jgi:hypothetical protein
MALASTRPLFCENSSMTSGPHVATLPAPAGQRSLVPALVAELTVQAGSAQQQRQTVSVNAGVKPDTPTAALSPGSVFETCPT